MQKRSLFSLLQWHTFITVFILNKCYTISGVFLLMIIIIPLTCATPTSPGGQASGWILIAICALSLVVFIMIKLVLAHKI